MGKLYVVRHSLSYYNEIGKYAGNQDIPLSKKGIKNSLELGLKFQQEYPNANIDYVFTSTLSRSFDTAVLMLSELNLNKIPIKISRTKLGKFNKPDMLPIIQFSELKERHYGILQNMDKTEVERRIDPQTLLNWRRNFYDGPKDGETFQRVVSRVAKFYFTILEPILQNKDVLLVAHQNTIRALYYLIYNIDKKMIEKVEFENSDFWSFDIHSESNNVDVIPKNVIILASGKGTRLKEYTKETPKPLVQVNGKELISHTLDKFLSDNYNVTITYSYLKERWDDFIKKHEAVNFCLTEEENLYWQEFLHAYKLTKNKSNYFIVMSGDMLIDYSVVSDAINEHIINSHDISVVLSEKHGKWKKWKYTFGKKSTIKDISIADEVQPFERYFLIINKDVIEKFLHHSSSEGFIAETEYGSGACFIVKTILDMGIKVNYIKSEKFLININDPDDLNVAKKYLKGNN